MSKRLSLFILICLLVLQTPAQKLNTDSIWRLIENAKDDSTTMVLLHPLNGYYQSISIDSNILFDKKVLALADKRKSIPLQQFATINIAYPFIRMADYNKVQEYISKAYRLLEKNPNDFVLGMIYNTYGLIEVDSLKRIEYFRKAIMLLRNKKSKLSSPAGGFLVCNNLARQFAYKGMIDSATYYCNMGNELFLKGKYTLNTFTSTQIISMQSTLGYVALAKKEFDIAYLYFKRVLWIAEKYQLPYQLSRAYQGLFSYFVEIKKMDSALFYQQKTMRLLNLSQTAIKPKIESAQWLYKYYLQKGNKDSTIKYMDNFIALNDSVNNSSKIIQVQKAKFEEDLKQRDLEIAKAEEQQSRQHNIQLAITAIVILSVIILFLLLSRSILVSHKVVEFLSVLVLLVVFEFINLLIHPFLESITHHSPVLMLLGLVVIASLIIPLHHRLEHWITKKLVEKNKAIRLANAKKTIEEIESSNK